ncbi:MAG TPA: hypothetical protein DCR14_12410 [Acidimicrobiaceae bacterium]|nr:hypothetical protein [Acidimicrobiaceae bacterium]
MRDEWGPIDPDEIELIEPDFDAFGSTTPSSEPDDVGDAATARPRRRWLIGAAVLATLGTLVAGVLVWAPWQNDGPLSFDSSGGDVTLSDRLVIADAPGSVRYRDNTDNTFFENRDDPVGYFFAEPGARLPMSEEEAAEFGRWVAAFAMVDDGDSDPESTDTAAAITVRGVAGTIERTGALTVVDFGPIDGLIYSVGAVGLSDDEVLAFAEAVRIDGDVTIVTDRRVVEGMEPIGSFSDYRAVLDLLFAVADVPWGPGPTVCYDAPERWCLASDIASDDALALVQFVAGINASAKVHGEPALVGVNTTDQFSDELTVVAWLEGGRLVMLAGTGSEADGLALAESVREATDDEWREVLANTRDDEGFDFNG